MLVLTDVPGFGESRSTWNIKNIKPNNAGPRPLHKPRMPVIIPWTAPTVDKQFHSQFGPVMINGIIGVFLPSLEFAWYCKIKLLIKSLKFNPFSLVTACVYKK